MITPTTRLEQQWWQRDQLVVGVDEVGRGAVAGPVYTAAVVLPKHSRLPAETLAPDEVKTVLLPALLRDSKKLSPRQRQALVPVIEEVALAWALGSASVEEVNDLGIVPATFLAMQRSLAALSGSWDHLLLDGSLPYPGVSADKQSVIVGGDATVASIAAASVLAKMARDAYMVDLDATWPGYGFAQHKGYGTAAHQMAVRQQGVSPHHRSLFVRGWSLAA